MSRFDEYNRLIYGETIGWLGKKRVVKELTREEYRILLSLLAHWKTRLRWSAADRLGKLGNGRAVEALIKALQDTHWLVRLHAAKALGRIGESIAIEPLVEIMGDECPFVRRRVVTALAQLNSGRSMQITKALISGLSDSDKGVRARAAWGLGDTVSLPAVAAIATAVCDRDTNVSWRAIQALQRIGIPAVKALIELLACPDSEVRYRAVKTLGEMGAQQAVKPLKKMLDDPSEKVRWRAKMALQQIERHAAWRKPPSKAMQFWHWWQRLWGRG
jgi:HEAT repeat protein